MIIKLKQNNVETTDKKGKNTFKNFSKKKLISIIFLVLLIIIGVIIVIYSKQNSNITIDIISKDISYIYGPNSSTSSDLKIGQEIELKIISDKKGFIKCYSTNEDVISFVNLKKAKAKSIGNSQVYCKINNNLSNVIKVVVGE